MEAPSTYCRSTERGGGIPFSTEAARPRSLVAHLVSGGGGESDPEETQPELNSNILTRICLSSRGRPFPTAHGSVHPASNRGKTLGVLSLQ